MKLCKLVSAALMGAMLTMAAPGQAAVYRIAIAGTITEGEDPYGFFGSPLSDLTGYKYKSVYHLTDPLPGAYFYDDGTNYYIEGGNYNSTPSPVSATIKLNNSLKRISGNFGSSVDKSYQFAGWRGTIYISTEEINEYYDRWDDLWLYEGIASKTAAFNWPTNSQKFSYDVQDEDGVNGQLVFAAYNTLSNQYSYLGYAALSPQRITISKISDGSAAPEPSTWGLMILGFGGIGAAMRRRVSAGRLTPRVSYSQ